MAWTTPKTWTTEPLTSSDMNTHIRDNLLALKEPPTQVVTQPGDVATTSTTFVDLAGMSATVITTGGDVLCGVCVSLGHAPGAAIYLNISVDGVDHAASNGVTLCQPSAPLVVSFVYLVTGLAAGSHTFKVRWKTASGTAYAYGLTGSGINPQFWAREVS